MLVVLLLCRICAHTTLRFYKLSHTIVLNIFEDILKDNKQQLFHQCVADISPTMKCSRNALDILCEKPLCREHSQRKVSCFLSVCMGYMCSSTYTLI